MTRGAVAVAFAIAVASGCASAPSFAAPKISVVSVAFDRLEGPDAYFTVDVQLANPNGPALAVDSLDATLTLEGEAVAHAALVAPVTLVADGNTDASLAARARMDAVLRAAGNAMRAGTVAPGVGFPALHYSVDGTAVVSGLRIPFSRSGELGPPTARAR